MDETLDIHQMMAEMGARARAASKALALASTEAKNKALTIAAQELRTSRTDILEANAKDIEFGEKKGLTGAMIDRLVLNKDRIEAIAKGLEDIAALKDPVGDVIAQWDRPNGLNISRVRVPLGVIGVIYESAPT
nr:hypothetical protein [Kordiimonas gwangyangensis]